MHVLAPRGAIGGPTLPARCAVPARAAASRCATSARALRDAAPQSLAPLSFERREGATTAEEAYALDSKEEPPVQLEPWQEERLQEAMRAAGGRRRFGVAVLAEELQLDRAELLAWLRQNAAAAGPAQEAQPQPPRAARPASHAASSDDDSADDDDEQPAASGRVYASRVGAGTSSVWTSAVESSPASDEPRRGPAGAPPPGVPYWRSPTRKARLGRDQKDTLERLYRASRFPSDELLASLWDLVRLDKAVALEWFRSRRVADAEAAAALHGGPPSPRRRAQNALQTNAYDAPRRRWAPAPVPRAEGGKAAGDGGEEGSVAAATRDWPRRPSTAFQSGGRGGGGDYRGGGRGGMARR